MIPQPGDERDDMINKWLGYKWGVDDQGWTWVETPSGYRNRWARVLRHWDWYLPSYERPGQWSTDDAAALKLCKILQQRGYYVELCFWPVGTCSCSVDGNTGLHQADRDSLADAITQAVCEVIEWERHE